MNIDIESLKKHVPEELSVTPIIYTYYRAKAKIKKKLKKHVVRSIERVIWRILEMRRSPNKGSSLFIFERQPRTIFNSFYRRES